MVIRSSYLHNGIFHIASAPSCHFNFTYLPEVMMNFMALNSPTMVSSSKIKPLYLYKTITFSKTHTNKLNLCSRNHVYRQTDGWTEGQTDGRTRWIQYTPPPTIKTLHISTMRMRWGVSFVNSWYVGCFYIKMPSYHYRTSIIKIRWFHDNLTFIMKIPISGKMVFISLHWRHNGHDSVSNHQPHDYLHNRLFRRRSKKISKLRITGLCEGNSPRTGEFPAQMASNAENISIWWRHHDWNETYICILPLTHGAQYTPWNLGPYHASWCPGDARNQVINIKEACLLTLNSLSPQPPTAITLNRYNGDVIPFFGEWISITWDVSVMRKQGWW